MAVVAAVPGVVVMAMCVFVVVAALGGAGVGSCGSFGRLSGFFLRRLLGLVLLDFFVREVLQHRDLMAAVGSREGGWELWYAGWSVRCRLVSCCSQVRLVAV